MHSTFKRFGHFCFSIIVLSALVHSCDREPDDPDSIPEIEVFELFVDENGTKWAATAEGLLVYKNSVWQTVENTHVSDKPIYDIAFKQGIDGPALWLATGDGVSVASYEIDDVISATMYSGSDIGFTSNSSQSISADISQTLWIGSADELTVFNRNTWFTPVSAADTIATIANDGMGMNFIGTRNGGVEIFTQSVDAISSATLWTKDWTPLKSDAINHILIVDDTCQWYSTNRGVALQKGYNFKNPNDWETYTTSEGLLCDTVYCSAR